MKIVILVIGTAGDVQPCIALGVSLKRAGHDIVLATHWCFESLVSAYGLNFAPLVGDPLRWGKDGELGLLSGCGNNFRRWLATPHSLAEPLIAPVLDSCYAACLEADAIIYSPLAWAGYSVAEKLDVPSFAVCLRP